MSIATIVILAILVVAIFFSGRRMIRTWTGKSGCHGGGGECSCEHEKKKNFLKE